MTQVDETFLRYSALDSACMMEIHDAIWEDLDHEFAKTYQMTEALFPVLMFMQTRGVRTSQALLEETKRDVLRKSAEKQEELDRLCGRPLNVNSPAQCKQYFYEELGIPPYTGKTGKPTVDDMALQRLARGTSQRAGRPEATLIQEIRGLEKLYGTYLNMEFDEDGRMRGSYNARGTKFGRLSSGKTVFETGMNFQNLPDEFKKFLIPDEGYAFIELDKRQAEWVVVAYASGDANMLMAVKEGLDVHTHTAHLMFRLPKDLIKYENNLIGHSTDAASIKRLRAADPKISPFMTDLPRTMSARQAGKKSNHGLNYGEGPYNFALINEMPQAEGKRIFNLYHQIYPGITKWYEAIQHTLRHGRVLENCFGRKVRFLGQWGDDLFKSAYSMIPQSTVVDSLNSGMVKIYNDKRITKEFNLDILAQVHDSILMQVPLEVLADKKLYEELWMLLDDYTSPTLEYNTEKFKIASDLKMSCSNWGSFNKEQNPNGMQDVSCHDDVLKIIENWEKSSGSGTGELA